MRIAIPIWDGRVSPVLDSARQLLLVDYDGTTETGRSTQTLPDLNPMRKAAYLHAQGVSVLLCGALSRQLHMLANRAGVEVHGWLCGEVGDVLQAYLNGTLTPDRYCLPGCHRGFGGGRRGSGCGRGRRTGAAARNREKS
ncbi:MAG: hypothetical protein KKA42_01390 [candidate division Zixibacteria bacterium]|nr:hypothetical protein [candidate division Zixibacteria bacterium]